MNGDGKSGGLYGGMSLKRAPQDPRGSSRHGQSAGSTERSSSKISAPYFTARAAGVTDRLWEMSDVVDMLDALQAKEKRDGRPLFDVCE
jgi:hypothetical protein